MYVSLYPPVLSSRCPRPPPSLTYGEEHGGLSRLECLDSASDPGWQGLIPTETSPSLPLRFPSLGSLLPLFHAHSAPPLGRQDGKPRYDREAQARQTTFPRPEKERRKRSRDAAGERGRRRCVSTPDICWGGDATGALN